MMADENCRESINLFVFFSQDEDAEELQVVSEIKDI